MQITNIEDITWKFSEPAEFSCMICKSNKAILFLSCILQDVRLKLAVCPDCANLDPSLIELGILDMGE